MMNEGFRLGAPRARIELNSVRSAICIAACFIFAAVSRSDPPRIQVAPGDVKDIRPNGKQRGGLEVEVKISDGEIPNDAKAFRVTVMKAVDDTGLDLVTPESATPEFKSMQASKTFKLKLKSPARKAGTIRELSGDVELFVPENDPVAAVVVNSFQKHMGSPIESDTLRSAGLEITARTGEQYEALKEKRKAERIKAAEPKQREAMQASARRTRGWMSMEPNDIDLSIKGANEKLAGFEFRDPSDKAIQTLSSGMTYTQEGQQSERTLYYHFQTRLPDTTKLVIFVATPESLVKVPFALADVALP
jgi:hypothetical protein